MTIYFVKPVGQQGPIKIGSTRGSVQLRLSQMMSGSPVPLELIVEALGDYELALHGHLADARSHGEWFRPVPRLLAGIEALKSGARISEAFDLTDQRGNIRRSASAVGWQTRRANQAARVATPAPIEGQAA
jgi:hypothetical protein